MPAEHAGTIVGLSADSIRRKLESVVAAMRRQAILLGLTILLGAVAGLPPPAALAGNFSAAVRLPTKSVGEEIEVEPIATSPNGQAVFYVTCQERSHQEGSQYLIRYTP